MKNFTVILAILILTSCASNKKNQVKPLFEILMENSNGGSKIEFYEILTEANEFLVLLNDPELKGLVKAKDIESANYLILNLGEKNTGGYAIGVESATENANNIVVKIKKTSPLAGDNVTYAFTNPFTVVKINSKKPIIFEEVR